MELIYKNHSEILKNILYESKKNVTIVSPFIKKEMAYKISRTLNQNIKLKVLTTLDSDAIKNGLFDIEALIILKENFSKLEINIENSLHAKIYIFDNQKALLTSANLTNAGFKSNIEYGIMINEYKHLKKIIDDVEKLFLKSKTLEEWDENSFFRNARMANNQKHPNIKEIQKSIKLLKESDFRPIKRHHFLLNENKKNNNDWLNEIDFKKTEIQLSIGNNYRKNMVDKSLLNNIIFRLNDIIQFHKNNDYNLDSYYQIIRAKSYKGDNIIDQKIDFNKKKVYVNFREVTKNDNRPSTIFFLQSINSGEEIKLEEQQLLYYYKSHCN